MFDSKRTFVTRVLVILSSVAALVLCSHVHKVLAQKINKKEGVQTRSSFGTGSKRVMILNSYHPGYKWTGYLVEGIKQTLEDRIDNLKLYIEYMDTKRIMSDEYLQKYYEVLRMKYTGVPLDLIIVSDDNAFQFLLRQHDELFGNIPVVFCGVNNFEESMIKGKDYITGIIQAPSVKETIDMALDLHPGVQQIVVLSDASSTGQAYQRSVKKVAEGYRGLEFVYLDGKNLTHYELFSRLSGLSRKSIVLLTVWLRDRTGNFLPMAEAISTISSSSTTPVYGLIEVPLEYGMLGGKIQSGWYQGQKAAEIALQIMLEGKSPVDVPVVMESPNKYIFAYQQLQRWRIPEKKLPEDSIILGKPRSLYEENRHLIWSLLSILAFLMISVVVLAANNIKRRRAEKGLKESEERYRLVVENQTDMIVSFDLEGKLLFVSPSYCKTFGKTEEGLIGKKFIPLIHEEDREKVAEAIKKTYKPPYNAYVEERALTKDGWQWQEWINTAILDEKNEIVSMVAVGRNINERKKAEEETKKTKEFYASILNSIIDGVWVTDKDDVIYYANKGIELIAGIPAEKIVGARVLIDFSEDTLKYFSSYYLKAKETLSPMRFDEISIITPAGRQSYQSGWLIPRGIDGMFNGMICTVEDITERKKAIETLKESEAQYRILMEQASVGIFIADTQGKQMDVNTEACKMLGYSRDELMQLNIKDLLFEEDLKEFPLRMSELLEGKTMLSERRMRRKDGTSVFTELSAKMLPDGRLQGIARDITERKKVEEEQQKVSKLESIGILAGGLAHDFNNLLAGILNNVYLSKMLIDRGSKAYKSLESAEKAIYRATNLTQQLLTFSRGGTPIKKTASIIEIIEESAEFALKGSNVKCEYIVAENIRPVEVDEGQMNQVIHNLILNACQSMPVGGIIRVNTENIELGPDTDLPLQEGRYVKVVLQDQGTGISEEHLQKLFDPYFTTKEAGRGLGLSITYSIIKQHDGLLTAESELGAGTTFTIYLPASEKQIEEKEYVENTLVPGEGKILLMDDEEIIRESVGEFLTMKGFKIEFAKDGKEAIALYRKTMETSKPFDAVILDLTIRGGMGGKETVKKLLEIDPHVKAIVSSGYSSDPVMANFREYGFCDVFCKASGNPDDLCRILNKVIRG